MWVIIGLLAIASGTVLAVVVVVKMKEARESRERRTTATPYGVLMGPTDGELRRTREIHPENLEIIGRWKENCVTCGGYGCLGDGTEICSDCDGQGTVLTKEKE